MKKTTYVKLRGFYEGKRYLTDMPETIIVPKKDIRMGQEDEGTTNLLIGTMKFTLTQTSAEQFNNHLTDLT